MRQREQREQIGRIVTPFAERLVDVEKRCLLRITEAARESRHLQVAMNSILSAQRLETESTPTVSQEFASVLWLHKEQKLAIQLLKQLLNVSRSPTTRTVAVEASCDATLLARLVSETMHSAQRAVTYSCIRALGSLKPVWKSLWR
jgi:serine-protein kinase ATM